MCWAPSVDAPPVHSVSPVVQALSRNSSMRARNPGRGSYSTCVLDHGGHGVTEGASTDESAFNPGCQFFERDLLDSVRRRAPRALCVPCGSSAVPQYHRASERSQTEFVTVHAICVLNHGGHWGHRGASTDEQQPIPVVTSLNEIWWAPSVDVPPLHAVSPVVQAPSRNSTDAREKSRSGFVFNGCFEPRRTRGAQRVHRRTNNSQSWSSIH